MKTIIKCCFVALFLMPALLTAQPDRVYRSLDEVTVPDSVFVLKLTHKRLKAIPQDVFAFHNLRVLDLSKNFIREIPAEIGRLSSLEELNLERNHIRTVPDEMGNLVQLCRLNLSRNPILNLPASMGNLCRLEELRIWSTGVIDFPASFASLNYTLKVIDMRACPLTYDNQEAIEQLLPTPQKKWFRTCNCH